MGCCLRARLSVLVIIGVFALSFGAQGQVVGPVGQPFLVNTYTSGYQGYPATCGTNDGRFVVVWDGGQQVRTEIHGRRYASNGVPVGSEFQVNTYTTGKQIRPSICCDDEGSFVVVWQQSEGEDGDRDGVFGQRFTSAGTFSGSEFQVNTYTTDNQGYPTLCCDAGGDFVVTWQSYFQDGDRQGIFAQRFANNGMFQGTEFQVNTFTTQNQTAPGLCCAAHGDFVVAWERVGQAGSPFEISAQRFASDGAFQGTEFQVNTYTTGRQENPAVGCAANGDFVVAWQSYGQDGSSDGVFGQRFASAGAPRGEEFQVSNSTAHLQGYPAVCCDPDGDFIVAWESQFDGGRYGIGARGFADSGPPLYEEKLADFTTPSYQSDPAVVCREGQGFVVAWRTFVSPDGEASDISGRFFGLPTPTSSPTPTSTVPPPTASATRTASLTPSVRRPTATSTMTPTPTSTVPPPTATSTGAATATSSITPATAAPTNTAVAVRCVGDCDGNGAVTVDEVLLGVDIALELQPTRECPAFDSNSDEAVTITELVRAVDALLVACASG